MRRKSEICISFAFLFLIIFFISLIILFVFSEKVVKESPCVDGNGDINLEDFMCEKEYNYLFGEDITYPDSSIFSTLMTLSMISFIFTELLFLILAMFFTLEEASKKW